MPLLEDFPAMIYWIFWPLKLDGRFKHSMKGEDFSILFNITDFPPAALFKVKNGDFEIEAINNPDEKETEVDALVKTKFEFFSSLLRGGGVNIPKQMELGNIKITNLPKLLKLVGSLRETEVDAL